MGIRGPVSRDDSQEDIMKNEVDLDKRLKRVSVAKWGFWFFAFLVALVASTLYTNPHTPAGHDGYVREVPRIFGKGGYVGSVNGPGNFGFSLFRNRATNIDMRPATFNEAFKILARDDLMVTFRVQMIAQIKPDKSKEVVEMLGGKEWYSRIGQKPFRSFVRDAVKTYDSRDIKAHRDKLADYIYQKMSEHMQGQPIMIQKVVMGNIEYPASVTEAVEKKLKYQQDLERKEVERKIAQKEAEIRVEEARGIAEAQKIINTTLTEQYLQHEAIQAQLKMADSPNHTTVYIPSGTNGIPVVKVAK